MPSPRILVFSGSTRSGSFNSKLAALAARRIAAQGGEMTRLDLSAYPMPIYNGDIEAGSGVPAEALALHELLRSHQGVFIATPEYNSCIPPLLINVIAWISRVRSDGGQAAAFGKPVFAIGAASPGALGGYRSLMALRQMLELGLGARVLPSMVSVPGAGEAFDEQGELRNTRSAEALDRVVSSLLAALRSQRSDQGPGGG